MLELVLPAFIAGLLTFLAPCTLPLVPGFLAFIGGASAEEFRTGAPAAVRRRIFLNGVFYVLGFTAVFVLLGSLFGLGGRALISYRLPLSQIGGAFVIFFGLSILGIVRFPDAFFRSQNRVLAKFTPGSPTSSLLLGATFALGWTPCVGPVLGAILTLATVSATVGEGAVLLLVFAAGLAVPFLTLAAGFSSASDWLARYQSLLRTLFVLGGVLLVFLGALLILNQLNWWVTSVYQKTFDFLPWQRILDYL